MDAKLELSEEVRLRQGAAVFPRDLAAIVSSPKTTTSGFRIPTMRVKDVLLPSSSSPLAIRGLGGQIMVWHGVCSSISATPTGNRDSRHVRDPCSVLASQRRKIIVILFCPACEEGFDSQSILRLRKASVNSSELLDTSPYRALSQSSTAYDLTCLCPLSAVCRATN